VEAGFLKELIQEAEGTLWLQDTLDKIVLAKQKASAYYAVLRCQNTVSDVASKLGW